jgi:hypothetical protein
VDGTIAASGSDQGGTVRDGLDRQIARVSGEASFEEDDIDPTRAQLALDLLAQASPATAT